MEIIDQDFEVIPNQEQKAKKVLPKKPIIFGGIFFGVLLILVLLAVFLNFPLSRSEPIMPSPTPTPFPTFIPEISNPSFYATDSAVLKIEEELKKIEQELETTDLKEANLNLPVLDWKIDF